MGHCATGDCGNVCCLFPFNMGHRMRSAGLGQVTPLPQPCMLPDGSGVGVQQPDGSCAPFVVPGELPMPGAPAVPGLPPAVPGVPQLPAPGAIPGVVTEQECVRREGAAAADEEAKVIKYAAITAVVSGIVGLALGKVF